ncbi:MAG: hypothetical protein LBR07_03870 [Puniceicoccales bacterium]|jgi:hypothetical protein|nr:hypothetical protein [Puniceicoccales bacterium]
MTSSTTVFKSGDKLLMPLPNDLGILPKTYRIERTNHGFEVIDTELRARHLREVREAFATPCEVPAELIRTPD